MTDPAELVHRLAPDWRGRLLLLLAAGWALMGWYLMTRPDVDPSHLVPIEHLPLSVRGLIWLTAAAVAVAVAWSPRRAHWGFAALVVPTALRMMSFGAATILSWPGHWIEVAIWTWVTAAVMLLAALPVLPSTSVREAE